ncbi:MAG: gliding motility-associated ABC transporter substrate-binding protein GldG [Sphingobacteriaceae bacterium]|nr:gliding motility-associated ABC transporter substrate-binding protein GldG [Sphingobacteriaceae bacterium]
MTQKKMIRKRKDIVMLLAVLTIVILINFVGSFVFKRFDLTSEKRYTLSESSRKLLKSLDDIVYIKVYLQGDFNPNFTRLKNETKELLDEFRAYSNGNLEYELINPLDNPSKEETDKIEKQLYDKGIMPEQIVDRSSQKVSETFIWPGAIITYKGKESVWQIYKRQLGFEAEQSINNSVQEMEYGLTNAIRKTTLIKKPEVLFVEGHDELDTIRGADFMRSVAEYYNVSRVNINHKLYALKGADAIVIAQPDSMFDEKDKFIIDQFIMHGGKVLWLIDPVYVNRDTLTTRGYSLGFRNELNLEDMLFKYGVRLNPVLVQDLQSAQVPVNVGFKMGQPDFKPFYWNYYPLILPSSNHPIVKNLDLIRTEYIGTLDTVFSRDVTKTILLQTSRYTKTQPTPVRILAAQVKLKPNESQYNNSFQNVACLLEGQFESNYKNRITRRILEDSLFDFKSKSKPTKMIIVADGDIAKNEYQKGTGMIFPVGYDMYTKQQFANKTFLLNCMNYLLDDEGLLQLRSREVKLRLLDKKKTATQVAKWKFTNVGIPLILIICFGLIQYYIRKKKYSH